MSQEYNLEEYDNEIDNEMDTSSDVTNLLRHEEMLPELTQISITEAICFVKSSIDLEDFKARPKNYLWWLGEFASNNDGTSYTIVPLITCEYNDIDIELHFKYKMLEAVESYMNLYGMTIDYKSSCDFVRYTNIDKKGNIFFSNFIVLDRTEDYDICCYIWGLLDEIHNSSGDISEIMDSILVKDVGSIIKDYLFY